MLGVEFHVLDIKVDKFLQPYASTEKEFDNHSIPGCHHRRPTAKLLEQAEFLRLGEEPGWFTRKPVQGQRRSRVLPHKPVLLCPCEE